jgi:alpha-L-arabinofuranosidase
MNCRWNQIVLAGWLAFFLHPSMASAAEPKATGTSTITVHAQDDLAPVPRRLFGTGLRPNMESHATIRAFLKETGITLFRYPDSLDKGYRWDWEAGGIMVRKNGPLISPLGRFDEAIAVAREIGAELFFTVKIFDSSPEEAAQWVSEAKRRGLGGGYWCFGNEPYFRGSSDYLPPEEYIDLVNRYAPVMKQADPEIRLGIAWGGPYIEEHADKGRDSDVLRGTRAHIDFIDFHFYTGRFETDRGPDPKRTMAGALLVAEHTRKFREIFRRVAPEKADAIEIHYWEWSGPPWPTLGGMQNLATAVFAADTLGEMARHSVRAAIQYNLQEHHCGLIPGFQQDMKGSYPTEPWNGRTVRPIAYALQLWSREMGSVMVRTETKSRGSYHTKDWHTLVNYQGEVPFLNAHATRSEDGKSLQLMIINRDDQNPHEVDVRIEGFTPHREVAVLLLNGPSALSHNDVVDRKPIYRSFPDAPDPIVTLQRSQWSGAAAQFRYTVPPHSVTVLQLRESP